MKQKFGKTLLVLAVFIGLVTVWGTNFVSAEEKVYEIQWKNSYETYGNFITIDGQLGGLGVYYLYDRVSGTSIIVDGKNMPLLLWTYGNYEQGFDPSTMVITQDSFATANNVDFLCNVKTDNLTEQPLAVLKTAGISIPESAAKPGNYSSIEPGEVEEADEAIKFNFSANGKELQFWLLPNYGDHGWSRMYTKEGNDDIEVVFGTDVVDKRSLVLYELKNGFTYIGKIGIMDFTDMVDSYISKNEQLKDRTYFCFALLNR